MRAEINSQPDTILQLPPIDVGAGLLELFAPVSLTMSAAASLLRNEHARLWRADAIHRAKNLARMSEV